MTLGLLSILLGVAILISGKDRMARVPAHKVMATLGSVFIILGILYGFYMIQVSTGEHFGQPIGFLGISTVIILLISLRFGFILVKNDPEVDMVRYKINHKWISRIAILFIIINILMGLSIAGVI